MFCMRFIVVIKTIVGMSRVIECDVTGPVPQQSAGNDCLCRTTSRVALATSSTELLPRVMWNQLPDSLPTIQF